MPFEHYIRSGQKLLRCGYTTGTCAALAAAGAAKLLLTGQKSEELSLVTPKGLPVDVEPAELYLDGDTAYCAVIKDGGDDADVTNRLAVWAAVRKTEGNSIAIDGGEGVGRVTKPGLDQPVGAAAINRVPRKMIEEQVAAVCKAAGYSGGLAVVISIPGGEAAARRTFNPSLGVEGGLSILGTSGIVEPMSEQAIVDTIAIELRQNAAAGARRLILTPGNYGATYIKENGLDRLGVPVVRCSNFIGDALDAAAVAGYEQVLLVGHIGKLVKLAGGVMNTHSKYADCRQELFCAHAAMAGASADTCRALMDAATTDACIALLDKAGLRERVLESLAGAVDRHLAHRAAGAYRIGAVLFSNEYGLLAESCEGQAILDEWRKRG